MCSHSTTLKDRDWFGTDWLHCPGIHWVVHIVPSGYVAQNFGHGFLLGGWATAPWVFFWNRGRSTPWEQKFPILFPQGQVSMLYFLLGLYLCPLHRPGRCYNTHTEALTTCTQNALNSGLQTVSLQNTGMSLMRKTLLQNRMALDIITAW